MDISKIKDIANIGMLGAVAYVGYKAISTGEKIGEGLADSIGGFIGRVTSPDIAEPVLRLKAQYFGENGDLTPQALAVISANFPNFYKTAFEGARIKTAFSGLVGSGRAIIDSDFK